MTMKAKVFLFVDGVKLYQFKEKHFETNAYPLCLGNISETFTVGNMKKPRLYGPVYNFSVDYDSIDVDFTLDIHKHLTKKQ